MLFLKKMNLFKEGVDSSQETISVMASSIKMFAFSTSVWYCWQETTRTKKPYVFALY